MCAHTFFMAFCLLVGIWVTSTFWLLWMQTSSSTWPLGSTLSIPSCVCLEVKSLGHGATTHSIFGGTTELVSIMSTPFYISASNVQEHSYQHFINNCLCNCSSEYFIVFNLLFTLVAYLVDTCFYSQWLLGPADTRLVYLKDTHTDVFIPCSVWEVFWLRS